jgi:hypothetical protein
MQLYRFLGSAEYKAAFELTNRNAADANGAISILCLERFNPGGLNTSLLSAWDVSANASFGKYAHCNFDSEQRKNYCAGGDFHQVGREYALCGISPGTGEKCPGQCTQNEDYGSWYSLPLGGKCSSRSVATMLEGCTWSARPLRVVHASCVIKSLQNQGMCKAWWQPTSPADFNQAAAVLEAALSSSDPHHGGCPDAGVATKEDVTII